MTIIVCVDDNGGVLFNRRRVSSDRIVSARMLELAGDRKLYVRPYSEKLFASNEKLYIGEDYLSCAGMGDYCLLEEQIPSDLWERTERVVVFYWNRRYPSDVKFPLAHLRTAARMESRSEFPGYSHERITQEVYVLSKSKD